MLIKNLKSNNTKIILNIILIIIFSVFSYSSFFTRSASAGTVEDLQAKIDEKNKNIEALNKEIQMYADLSDKTSAQAKTLQSKIQSLTQNGKMLDADIKKTKTQIDVANLDIQRIGKNIKVSEDKVGQYSGAIKNEIKNMQSSEDFTLIENLLSKKNMSDVLIEIDSLRSLGKALGEHVDSLKNEKKILLTDKNQKEDTKKQLSVLQTELSGKKKVVEANKQEQSQILKETKDQEKTYQQILADRQKQKESLEKELFDYEATLKYTLNPSLTKNTSDRPFSWPLDKIIITQLFGKTKDSKRLYVSGSHNGVDFGAKIGTPAKAVLSGTIIGTGDTDLTCKGASWGRWVLIKHDNGLATIYGHLSVISVSEGQKVTTGDIIGYTGNTGYTTGPHLHITVYDASAVQVENRPSISCGGKVYRMPIAPIAAYLDPMLYFPRK